MQQEPPGSHSLHALKPTRAPRTHLHQTLPSRRMLLARSASALRFRTLRLSALARFSTSPPSSFFTGPMFKNQGPHALPKLPVPTLEETLAKFEWTVQPLLRSDDERKITASECAAFLNGKGRELQAELIQYDLERPHSNYIVDFW